MPAVPHPSRSSLSRPRAGRGAPGHPHQRPVETLRVTLSGGDLSPPAHHQHLSALGTQHHNPESGPIRQVANPFGRRSGFAAPGRRTADLQRRDPSCNLVGDDGD